MTHLDNTARTLSSTVTDRVRTGPVLIDPRDFKLVSGGLPKGGWGGQPPATANSTELPKGGW